MARPAEKCGPTIIHSAPSKQASGKSLLLISPLLNSPIHKAAAGGLGALDPWLDDPFPDYDTEPVVAFSAANNPEWYNSLYVNQGIESNAIWYGCTDVTADLTQGGWIVHAVAPATSPLTFGGTVRFESAMYPGAYLSRVGTSEYLYLSNKPDASTVWMLVPAPSGG